MSDQEVQQMLNQSEHRRDRAARAVAALQPESAAHARALLAMYAERDHLTASDVAHIAGLYRKARAR